MIKMLIRQIRAEKNYNAFHETALEKETFCTELTVTRCGLVNDSKVKLGMRLPSES